MFTVVKNERTHNIVYDSNEIQLTICPEDLQEFANTVINSDNGIINTNPSNGCFKIEWTPMFIEFSVAKYGDGQGGDMKIRIRSTPLIQKSFRDTLKEYREIAK